MLDSDPSQQVEEQFHNLSLIAMDITLASGTIRFIGLLNGHPVHILLDRGTDNNFIQPCLEKFLNLDIISAQSYRVLVGNGQTLQVEVIIENI